MAYLLRVWQGRVVAAVVIGETVPFALAVEDDAVTGGEHRLFGFLRIV
jgi:hypothetical protein